MVVPFHTPDAIVPTDVRLEDTTVEFRVVPVNVPAAAVTVCEPALVSDTDVPLSEMLVFERAMEALEPSPGVCVTVMPVPEVTPET